MHNKVCLTAPLGTSLVVDKQEMTFILKLLLILVQQFYDFCELNFFKDALANYSSTVNVSIWLIEKLLWSLYFRKHCIFSFSWEKNICMFYRIFLQLCLNCQFPFLSSWSLRFFFLWKHYIVKWKVHVHTK